jgi:hypothetical protein
VWDHRGVPHAQAIVPMLAAIVVAGGGLSSDGVHHESAPDSGVRGVAALGLRCLPISLERDTCGGRPRSASIVIRRASDRRWVATIRTDARGRFSKALEPGTYLLQARRAGERPPLPLPAQRVRVPAHRYVSVILR